MTDSSVAERLAACRPWVRALLAAMLPRPALAARPPPRRFLGIEASGIQAPGARGTPYRLHLCMEMVMLTFVYIAMTDKRTGERLKHFPLGPGDVAVADRGDGHPEAIVQTVPRGADVLLRLNPHNVPVAQRDGTALDWVAALPHQAPATVCTLPVLVAAAAGTERVDGWVHAYRVPEAQANRARQRCRTQNRQKRPQPTKRTVWLVGWVLVLTSLRPTLLPGPTALAVYRVRWQIEVAIKRWNSVLDADVLRARDGSPLADVWLHGTWLYALWLDRRLRRTLGDDWSRLDGERLAAPGHVVAPLETVARRGDATDDRRPVLATSAVARVCAGPGRTAPAANTPTAACRGYSWTAWVEHPVPTTAATGHCRTITPHPGAYAPSPSVRLHSPARTYQA